MRERKDEKKETKARAENCRWFRVTTNTKERDRERDGYKRVHCLRPSEFFVPPHSVDTTRSAPPASGGGNERNESKRIVVWIAKSWLVREAHRLIIIPNIISRQLIRPWWFPQLASAFFLPFSLFLPPPPICIRFDRVFFFSSKELEWIPFERNGNVSSRGLRSSLNLEGKEKGAWKNKNSSDHVSARLN